MKAYLKNYRQSPRKVRLVAGLIRRKNVGEALAQLDFLAKRAGGPIRKLLMSAVSNAKNQGKEMNDLFIQELRVDKGVVLKRMMPAAMGAAHRINKRTSNITLVLGEKVMPVKATKVKKETKEVKTTEVKAKTTKAKK